MDKKSNRLDPDFIARPAHMPSDPSRGLIRMPPGHLQGSSGGPAVPDVFDEYRIKQELAKIAGTPLVGKYVGLLKIKFSRATERKALEAWERFYSSAKKTVEAHTELIRAQHDYEQVEREYEIKGKQKDLESLTVEAEIEEQRLRLEAARAARLELQQEVIQARAQPSSRNEPTHLDQWYQEQRRLIMEDPTLSIDQQDTMLDQLKSQYRARKASATIDIS